ncbi:TPA: hypothetical protein DEW47_03065 [Patescibacteria group bacterium]|nr:hypothetical protein [Patescibacteria group bacterium]HCI04933.1 hypothetical protein [Patescibacteria group bacterium]
MEFWGFTIGLIGKIMVAFTAIAVHHRFLKEHKVDEGVFKTMKREQFVGILGVILMIIGYFLEIPSRFF